MLPDRVSNPGTLTYESGALPIVLRGPAKFCKVLFFLQRAVAVVFLFYVHGKHLGSCRDGQLT